MQSVKDALAQAQNQLAEAQEKMDAKNGEFSDNANDLNDMLQSMEDAVAAAKEAAAAEKAAAEAQQQQGDAQQGDQQQGDQQQGDQQQGDQQQGQQQQGDPADPPEYINLWGLKLGRDYILTAQRLPIYRTAMRYQGPAFILHGTADRLVPYTYGERFNDIWPKSEYVELEGFDHGFAQNIYRATDLVSSWLIRTLK
jgi:pimeloyl-ACP methyl ester carboxylesterase